MIESVKNVKSVMSFFLHGDIDNFGDIANIATFASAFFFFRLLRRNAIPTSFYYAARGTNR